MTQYEINTLALLRAFKLRSDMSNTKPTRTEVLVDLESMPDKPSSLPVSAETWRHVQIVLSQINALDKEDDILGPAPLILTPYGTNCLTDKW